MLEKNSCQRQMLMMRSYDGMKKSDLELALDEYLNKNSSQFASDSRYTSFYKSRRSESSPVKKEASSVLSDVDAKVKSVKRRVTKAAEELGVT